VPKRTSIENSRLPGPVRKTAIPKSATVSRFPGSSVEIFLSEAIRQRAAGARMSDSRSKPRAKAKVKVEKPRLHKVILLNDDYTPREFVVAVLKAVFAMSEEQALRVMVTAHQKGSCVVAVFTRDIAETKATEGTEAGKQAGFPLMFTTEPEE
jgi:ATP-dependent Clp protease adaptor protein ClpS